MKLLTAYIFFTIFVFIRTCEPPDCDRPDCGTCGIDPDNLNGVLSSFLMKGGPDMHYSFVATEDLRPYNISASYILQGIHTTFVKKYNDTLNFVIYPNKSSYKTKLSAFSISQIHGAYCDDGQNYKNLILLVKGLNIDYVENHVAGCPLNP